MLVGIKDKGVEIVEGLRVKRVGFRERKRWSYGGGGGGGGDGQRWSRKW